MRISPSLAALAALPAFATAQTAPQKSSDDDKSIVVTGVRLSILQDRLAACLKRRCPPDQDIAATLAVAESQFVDGKYANARSTLLKSIGRNKRYAKDYPEAVSDLLRANYRVAEHLGDGDAFRIGTFDTLSALKAGLPDDDYRVLGGEIEVGDMYVRFARFDEALQKYAAVERRGAKIGLYNIQGMAQLRIVALYCELAAASPQMYRTDARKSAQELIGATEPHLKPFGQAARVLLARLDAKAGDTAAVDRLILEYRTAGSNNVPVLLYSPPIDLSGANSRQNVSGVSSMSGSGAGVMLSDTTMMRAARLNYDGEWVDIGFWVTPDGRVSDADVLRGGRGLDKPYYWVKPILAAISARRYAPLKMDASQPGILRVERYTLTSRLTSQTGSRLIVREPSPQIEMLDLSVDPPAAPSSVN